MTMEMRDLGRSGLKTAPLVLGGNVFGWTADRTTSFSVLDAFLEGGFAVFVGRHFGLVDDTKRYFVAPLESFLVGLIKITRIPTFVLEFVDSFFEPGVGVDFVVGNTGAEDID